MHIRTSFVAGLAAILLSTAAFADSTPATTTTKPTTTTNTTQQMTDRCTALETEFDQAITTHGTAPKAAAAKTLRAKGGRLCAANKPAIGIKDLQTALKELGLKPSA